jgi:putative salt-induced outer membrane protein YdiY
MLFAVLLGLAAPAFAQETDVVLLANGDRFTGEIKAYEEGRIKLSTPDAGDISIKWNKVASITSDKTFDIELTDGTHVFGTLRPSKPPGHLDVVGEAGTRTIEYFSVVRMTPIYQTFWRRISGTFDLGFNYTQANQFVQFNVNGDATYRTKAFAVKTRLSAFFSKQQGVTSSQRASLNLTYQYFLSKRWFLAGLLGLEKNRDLGLNLRATGGIGAGRYLVQTNQSQLAVLVGATVNREDPLEGDAKTTAEAIVGATYSTFMYDFPKLTFSASLNVVPSITEGGRVRLQANASVKREIVRDFYLSISVFDSFDSRPPTEGAAKNDWGPVISIGYKF